MSESPSREIRHRKSKQYCYNAWEDIKGRQVQMTFEQAAEINPTIKQQIRNGLAETKPSYKVTEINQAQPNDSDSENEEDTRKTSAYAVGTIENIPVEFVIDSGARGCMIAKETLDHLGWSIDAPTNQTFTTTNGATAVPLGKVREVPVRFGEITIPVDMIVVQTTTYKVILGNEWLKKAQAVIDLNAEKIKITRRGRTYLIPLNIDKGIRPRFEEAPENDEVYVAAPTQQEPETWTLSKSEQELIYAKEEIRERSTELPRIYEEEILTLQEINQDSDDKEPKENKWRILIEEERATAY